jgi:hypothetical protein
MKKKRLSKEQRKKNLREQTVTNVSNVSGFSSNYAISTPQGVEFFKPKQKKGRIKLDLLPYIIETDYDPSGMSSGNESYVLIYWSHWGVGPEEKTVLCLRKTFNKPCPICEEMQELKQNGAKDKEIDALKPKQRTLYNVIDKTNEDAGIQLFDVSFFLFEMELREEAQDSEDGETITFSDLEDGATIKCRATEVNKNGFTFFEYKSFDFLDREPYDESILDETHSLDSFLNVPTYEQVRNSFHGIEEEDEEAPFDADEDDDEVEETSKRKKKTNKKQKAAVVEEDEPDEDDEVEETSKKKKKTTKKTTGPKCPYDGVFGKDCDKLDQCVDDDCGMWDACADAKEALDE